MNKTFPVVDLEASLNRLSEWLKRVRGHKPDYVEEASRYQKLAAELMNMASLLDRQEWEYLEYRFNDPLPPSIGLNGVPIPCSINTSGRYQRLYWALRDLAETAEGIAGEAPKPRTKPELTTAAHFFLHLWKEASRPYPRMYDNSEAVIALRNVLKQAGIHLSPERVRGILKGAMESYDPIFCEDSVQLNGIRVYQEAE